MIKKVIVFFRLLGVDVYISAYTRKNKRALMLKVLGDRFK